MKDITFILLTKDRPEKLINFLKNHFFLLKKLKSNFLIIDASSSKNYKIIKKFTKKYKKIYLFRQKSKGFMQGCFESIKYVKSKYCTFLYDDDLLSSEIVKVYKNSINSKLRSLLFNSFIRLEDFPFPLLESSAILLDFSIDLIKF